MSSKGKLLKQFNLIDCGKVATAAGGINETRGVSRPRLLNALADQLPAGTIKFNSRVTGVDIGGAGEQKQRLTSVMQKAELIEKCKPLGYRTCCGA